MEIKRLDWDSNFFGFEVGEIDDNLNFDTNLNFKKFDLIVIKQSQNKKIEIENFKSSFQETKVVFKKLLIPNNSNPIDNLILDYDNQAIDNQLFYPLAFESGKHSRFKLDSKLKDKFELLYRRWVDNSLNKGFADKVFYLKLLEQIVGFVTVKNNQNYSTIGLIAVSYNLQGEGLGKRLVLKVEEYCLSQNILELRIPTQKSNIQACQFYSKLGYNILEESIIRHYWNTKF